MKYLTDKEVSFRLEHRWLDVIKCIEEAFTDPTAEMVPKTYLKAHPQGDFRAMPSALGDHACLKWIGVYPNNHLVSDLPTTLGTLLLNNRETGEPLMAIDCTTLTAYRTAATSAIAAKYCAPEAKSFAFIGCGLQAKYHIEAYESIFGHMNMDIELYDKNEKAQKDVFNWLGKENLCCAWGRNKSVKAAVKDADVITTLTPSREPYLDIHDIKSNCHINAVGADAVGKRELMTNVIDGSWHMIADDPNQAFNSGELQYNEWPELTVFRFEEFLKIHESMQLDKGVSVFDSTGVAIEDIAVASLIYEELTWAEHDQSWEDRYDTTSEFGGV